MSELLFVVNWPVAHRSMQFVHVFYCSIVDTHAIFSGDVLLVFLQRPFYCEAEAFLDESKYVLGI